MEPVVDGAVPLGLAHPGLETLHHPLSLRLHGEVDDGGGPPPGGGPGPGLEGVGGEGASERQLHVGMDVDPSREHELAGGVDGVVGRPAVAAGGGQPHHLLSFDEDIGCHLVGGGDDGPVGDERAWHGCHPPVARLTADSMMARPSATSSAVTVSGGAIRSVLP